MNEQPTQNQKSSWTLIAIAIVIWLLMTAMDIGGIYMNLTKQR